MKKDSPKLTVLMSVYNGEKHLKEAINSILNQTFKNYEFIIINDASTDQTKKIIKAYKDPRIVLIDNSKNIGLTKSLNKGLLRAKGEFVARMDADDRSDPERFEKQVLFLDEHPDYHLVGMNSFIINDCGIRIGETCFVQNYQDILEKMLESNTFVHSSIMFRRKTVLNLGLYDKTIKFCQDYDLYFRLIKNFKAANLPYYYHSWRKAQEGISQIRSEVQKKYFYKILKKYRGDIKGKISYFKKDKSNKFRVMAIIAGFNESDILYNVVGDLIQQGIAVYYIDNHSTDRSVEEVFKWFGKGWVHIEYFPFFMDEKSRANQYFWKELLIRKEVVASQQKADWYIHSDADEFREGPWVGLTLKESIQQVDKMGYNAINFKVFNFYPTNEDFIPGTDVRQYLKSYDSCEEYDQLQVKCWKNNEQKVDLRTHGGHLAKFKNIKIFPVSFILRHYPIRSSIQGKIKIFNNRILRFLPEEKKKGWHVQYNKYSTKKKSFLKKEKDLQTFNSLSAKNMVMQEGIDNLFLNYGSLDF